MLSVASILVGCIFLFLATITSVNVGLSWSAIRSPDVCTAPIHDYLYVVAVISTVTICLYILEMFWSFISATFPEKIQTGKSKRKIYDYLIIFKQQQ